MDMKEIDKLWYEYSRGNNPYADYQSFVAGYKAALTKRNKDEGTKV